MLRSPALGVAFVAVVIASIGLPGFAVFEARASIVGLAARWTVGDDPPARHAAARWPTTVGSSQSAWRGRPSGRGRIVAGTRITVTPFDVTASPGLVHHDLGRQSGVHRDRGVPRPGPDGGRDRDRRLRRPGGGRWPPAEHGDHRIVRTRRSRGEPGAGRDGCPVIVEPDAPVLRARLPRADPRSRQSAGARTQRSTSRS